jgi:protein unc-45
LIKKFLASHDDTDGEAALEYLHENPGISSQTARDAMEALMEYSGDADCADEMTGILLESQAGRKILAKQLMDRPTITFNKLFERGDDSMDHQTTLLLDKASWDSETDRIAAERDVFQLCLAQLMKAGQDFPERAMKAISRLLGVEAANLNGLMDADGFDVILSNLDIRMPSILRSQATLACVKLVELSPDTAKQLMSQYIISHIEKPSSEKLVQAFSAAAAVFPIDPESGSELFLTEGFLPTFVKLVEKYRSQRVEQSALELLNAACMDKKCRVAIRKYCPTWLKNFGSTPATERRLSQVTMAHLVLEKIQNTQTEGETPKTNPDEERKAQVQRMNRFKTLIVDQGSISDRSSVANALEGLSYASIDPVIKASLASDDNFLKSLIGLMHKADQSVLFGGMSILANLTAYRPVLSEEQKKMSELKAYANSKTPSVPSVLDDEDHVSARCTKVLNLGVVALINEKFGSLSTTGRLLALQILNSLSKDKQNRGKLAQQGALKTLLQAYDRFSVQGSAASQPAKLTAAHAAARILISINPAHAFSTSFPTVNSAVRPLVDLLQPQDLEDGSRDLLPTFEALLALTNLASLESGESTSPAVTILKLGWQKIEDLILNSNMRVQRAATELVCNLAASPAGAAHFADSKYGATRLKVLLALADADDDATRSAAAGALAMLTEWDPVVARLIKADDTGDKIWRIAEDENPDVALRGLSIVRNVALVGEAAGKKFVKIYGWEYKLLTMVQKGDAQIAEVARDVVAALK